MKTTVTLFIFLTVFSLNTFAQDIAYTSLEGHTGYVNSVAFSPGGLTLASGSNDDTIRLWEVATGRHLRTLEGHTRDVTSVAFSPDGQMLASGSDDDTIRLWEVATGRHLRTLEGHRNWVSSVAFSPDGQTLVNGSDDGTIRLWEAATGRHLRTLLGDEYGVRSVAFSPDGQTLASGGWDKTIRLWEAATGRHLRTLGRLGHVSSVAFSPDGRTLASGVYYSEGYDGTIRLWESDTGSHLRTLRDRSSVLSVVFSSDGRTLASGGDTIRLWDTDTGGEIQTFTGHTGDVNSVAFSPDGQTLASGSDDNTIRLWEIPQTRVRFMLDTVSSPAIGEQFTVDIGIVAGENVGGYQVSFRYDATALRYVESANGKYLPPGAFFVPPVVSRNKITLGATALNGVSSGDGVLATVTFEVVGVKESVIAIDETILTDSEGEHLPHLAYGVKVAPPLLTSAAVVRLMPASVLSPAIGEELTFNVDITGGQNVADFQLVLDYDRAALSVVSQGSGDYLTGGVGTGDGTLRTVTFEVREVKASTVSLSGYLVGSNGLRYTPIFESAVVTVPLFGDVNRDGTVNILDLVQVASSFGQPVPEEGNPADVNEDGVVNIVDLVKVAGALGEGAAAPSLHPQALAAFTAADVQHWLTQAQHVALNDAISQRGIRVLEQILDALTPKETALLVNYPNPFNPETWIPYQLAESANVTVSIYAADGKLVRMLNLGHRPIGIYQDKSRAAYWDGRNTLGEPVASGVYFYTLTADDFTATRKMLIRK